MSLGSRRDFVIGVDAMTWIRGTESVEVFIPYKWEAGVVLMFKDLVEQTGRRLGMS